MFFPTLSHNLSFLLLLPGNQDRCYTSNERSHARPTTAANYDANCDQGGLLIRNAHKSTNQMETFQLIEYIILPHSCWGGLSGWCPIRKHACTHFLLFNTCIRGIKPERERRSKRQTVIDEDQTRLDSRPCDHQKDIINTHLLPLFIRPSSVIYTLAGYCTTIPSSLFLSMDCNSNWLVAHTLDWLRGSE